MWDYVALGLWIAVGDVQDRREICVPDVHQEGIAEALTGDDNRWRFLDRLCIKPVFGECHPHIIFNKLIVVWQLEASQARSEIKGGRKEGIVSVI